MAGDGRNKRDFGGNVEALRYLSGSGETQVILHGALSPGVEDFLRKCTNSVQFVRFDFDCEICDAIIDGCPFEPGGRKLSNKLT